MNKNPKKSIYRIVLKITLWIFVILAILISIPVSMFWYDHYEHQRLISKYSAPLFFYRSFRVGDKGPLRELMENKEGIVCGLNSYDSIENSPQLNEKQKESLPKSQLPSESKLSWYLLFFADDGISRVFLIYEGFLVGDIGGPRSACVTRDGFYEVIESKDSSGKNIKVLRIFKKEK